jgi:acyl-CoA synthetase (NDP forming)
MRFLSENEFSQPQGFKQIESMLAEACNRPEGLLHEHEAYQILEKIGIVIPAWHFHSASESLETLKNKLTPQKLYVAKIVSKGITHKTDVGGIVFDVTNENASGVVQKLLKKFNYTQLDGILFAEKIDYKSRFGHEMLIGLYQDVFFGPCIAFGFGGTGTEYYKSIMKPHAAQLFIPAAIDLHSINHILKNIPVVEIIEGRVRGADKQLAYEEVIKVIGAFQTLGRYFSAHNPKTRFIIEEMEINPAVAQHQKVVALDAVLRVRRNEGPVRQPKPLSKINQLLSPSSVAIAGASGKNPYSPSNIILKKFLKGGMKPDQIYIVHPKEETIEGIPCVKDIPSLLAARNGKPVDCLVVGVPAKVAGGLIAEAMETYAAHSMQIIAAGFGETEAGIFMQQQLAEKLRSLDASKRPVINGPNTLGNIYRNTDTLFTPRYKSSGTGKGKNNAALICQSGAFMITRISDLADIIAPAVSISVGNQMDLSVTDFFEHLLSEKEITSYGLYIEGLNPGDGIRLMKLIKTAHEKGKFAVIYKAGRTEAGIKAAKGHTAAMAGDYDMFAHLMRRAGGMVADTFVEFQNLMMMTAYCDGLVKLMNLPHRKLGIAALSNAGFEKCAIADHLMKNNPATFELANYSLSTKERIKEIFVEHGLSGIMDIHDVLDLSPMMNDEGYEKIIRTTLEDENVDFGIYSIVPETAMLNTCEGGEGHKEDMMREGSILNRLIEIRRNAKKPFVVSFESGWKYDKFAAELLAAGIPVFRYADAAARTVAKCLDAIRRDVL